MPPISPLVDNFFRNEAPLSDSGNWYQTGIDVYDTPSAEILELVRHPPVAPSDVRETYPVYELASGRQMIGGFNGPNQPQPRHWAPSVGLRIDDHLAFITDTPYEASSTELADGVLHLLHEAWSSSQAPIYSDRDATAADAARVAREAGAADLTLIHLDPRLDDLAPLLADAAATFERVVLGEDEMTLV